MEMLLGVVLKFLFKIGLFFGLREEPRLTSLLLIGLVVWIFWMIARKIIDSGSQPKGE